MGFQQNPDQQGRPNNHIRANLFFRMRDLTHRVNNDPRLLVATMHSDLFPVSAIRGKCRVKHRDLISNGSAPELTAWKRNDDHFYFYQLFDRYNHRFYDVIPTYKVKNAPEQVLSVLRERYSFIVAEMSMSAELCDTLRGCAVCHQWAATSESVRCDTCRKFFHMSCLSPPLQTKPAKGYCWNCAPCARSHDEIVEECGVGGGGLDSKVNTAARGPRGQSHTSKRTKAHLFGDVIPMEDEHELRTPADREGLRCFNGWPYRYFGQHTDAMDVLDSHDSIYPRAVTRLGSKYQMDLSSFEKNIHESRNRLESERIEEVDGTNVQMRLLKPGPRIKNRPQYQKRKRADATGTSAVDVFTQDANDTQEQLIERGLDENLIIISVPPPDLDWNRGTKQFDSHAVDQYLKEVLAPKATIARCSYSFMNRALSILCDQKFNYEAAARIFAQSRDADFAYYPMTSKEINNIEQTILQKGGEMKHLKRALPSRSPAEIVQGVYQWKMRKLGERWRGKEKCKITLRGIRTVPGEQGRESSPTGSILSEQELEDMQDQKKTAKVGCAFCSTTMSPFWYKNLISAPGYALCVYCGQYWRKYAAETATAFITDDKRKAAYEKGSEQTNLGVLVPHASISSIYSKPEHLDSPVPMVQSEVGKCIMCRRSDPKKLLRSCAHCGMTGHQCCLGFTDKELDSEIWLCDTCANDEDPSASLLPCCVLCGETPNKRIIMSAVHNRKSIYNDPDCLNALDVYKPTECNNWVHLLCAMWTPDVMFADSIVMKPVEGVGSLPVSRYDVCCSICEEVKGVCVKCAEPTCRTQFHVSCAFLSQPACMLGFEIFPVKTSRRESVNTLTFKSETGHMCAQVWCKEHIGTAKSKKTYEFFEIDPKLKMNAMQAYARTHKQVTVSTNKSASLVESTHALLRRAKKLDALWTAGNRQVEQAGVIQPPQYDPMDLDEKRNVCEGFVDSKLQTCVKCHSDWSPLWWPVNDGAAYCCTMCHNDFVGTAVEV